MPTVAQVEALFRSHSRRDDEMFHSVSLQVIAHERSLGREATARNMERALGPIRERRSLTALPQSPIDKDGGGNLVRSTTPDEDWDRLVWEPATEATVRRVVEEHQAAPRLAERGLFPRNRLLFSGPPGNGKTVAARVLAGVLDLPLVEVDMQSAVNSHIGGTGNNMKRIAEFIGKFRCVAFFDEFDSLASARTEEGTSAAREGNRVVASLLRSLDELPPTTLLIAATNRPGLIDEAITRRFDAVCQFPAPNFEARVAIARRILIGFDDKGDGMADLIATKTPGFSGASVERIAMDSARSAVLDGSILVAPRHVMVA